MPYFQPIVRIALASVLAWLAPTAGSVLAQDADRTPEQKSRVRSETVEAAVKLVPSDFPFVAKGKLTVATVPYSLPLVDYASDAKTPIGFEPDLAQLLADGLGRDLELVPIAWADWPLGLASGKYDAVISNVTVTEERKEKFDFSSYRNDLLGFYAASNSKVTAIATPEDIAGLKVIVSAATNQEQILLRWIEANKAKGLPPTEVQYYDDQAVLDLALQSGRADVYLGPNATFARHVFRRLAADGRDRRGEPQGIRHCQRFYSCPQRADSIGQLHAGAAALEPRVRSHHRVEDKPTGIAKDEMMVPSRD